MPTKVLRWAADTSSSAPYVFQDPTDPTKLVGFEVDLIDALAAELGMTTTFVQNQWEGLIPGLNRGAYALAIKALKSRPIAVRRLRFLSPTI